MRRFFDNQKYDQIGITSVKLQKMLIFLMIFHAITFIWSFTIVSAIGTIFMLTLLFIGLKGAVKRNANLLRSYACGSLVWMIGSIVLALFFAFFFCSYSFQDPAYGTDAVIPLDVVNSNYTNGEEIMPLVAPVSNGPSTPSNSESDNSGMMDLSDPSNDDVTNANVTIPDITPIPVDIGTISVVPYTLLAIAIGLAIIVFVLHIATIVMSFKLARTLKDQAAQNLAHPRKQQEVEPQVVIPPPAMYVQVPVQPNNFGYFPMYTMNTNIQQQQPVFFNPYLQNMQQYYPPQRNEQI
jgi:hypothetical protein